MIGNVTLRIYTENTPGNNNNSFPHGLRVDNDTPIMTTEYKYESMNSASNKIKIHSVGSRVLCAGIYYHPRVPRYYKREDRSDDFRDIIFRIGWKFGGKKNTLDGIPTNLDDQLIVSVC